MESNVQRKRVVVIGAGYAGLLATVRLAGKTRGQTAITLVNASEDFVERLRLHQYAANQKVVSKPLSAALRNTGVELVTGLAIAIDPSTRQVTVQTPDGARLDLQYDRLLYALGSTIDIDTIPGVREHAFTLTPSGPRSAEELRRGLVELNSAGGRVTVVGGGPTGVEAAAEFAESYPRLTVSLITRAGVTETLGMPVQGRIMRSLERLGVSVMEGANVSEIGVRELTAEDGRKIGFDICVWAAGFRVPSLARESGIATNTRGQVSIDPFMRSISHADIFAAGDCAWPVEEPGAPVRMAAFTAVVMGAHAADCMANTLKGKKLKPLSFAYAGQGIALGRHDAVGFNNYPADHPNNPILTGWLAVRTREFFVRFLGNAAGYERRRAGLFMWLGKGRYAARMRQAHRAQQRQHLV